MNRRAAVLGALVVAVMMVASVAAAGEGDVVVEGTGKLVAAGSGNVELTGQGAAYFKMSGDITITDHAGDAEIVIRSANDTVDTESTVITLTDFTGVVGVRGSDFSASASGEFRRLAARGTGSVFLQGSGWYRTSGGHYGRWTPDGVRIEYRPAG